jgi:hypothetical protein
LTNEFSQLALTSSAAREKGALDYPGSYNYEGYEWYRNGSQKEESSRPETPATPYNPGGDVVERNEALVFALRAAPMVLLERFQHLSDLGVLGWCSEFSDLVDEIKALGFDGEMFTSTRETALNACMEILALNLDIKMQLIVLFLSSQIARLRRFLDAETEFDDYPESQSQRPLPPPEYT